MRLWSISHDHIAPWRYDIHRRVGARQRHVLLVAIAASLLIAACEDKTPTLSTAAANPSLAASPTPPAATPAPVASSAAPSVIAVPTAIAAQHVLVAFKGAENAPKGVTRSKADAKKRAEEVAAKAKAGTDFSALVAEYSDDPAAKERQGSVGKFTRDKMAKPFSDAAFALAVGESSGPVETPFGIHVIKRNQ